MTEPTSTGQQRGLLAAFRYRNYRFTWASGSIAATAVSMEMVVMGWLVLELTDSPALVGLVAALRLGAAVLAPFLGALSDRFERRRILMVVRMAGVFYMAVLALLYYTSLLEVWHVMLFTLFGGAVRVFDMITSNALAPESAGGNNVTSAVGMMMVGMSTTRMMGPLLGGYLYEYFGAGGCFAAMAVIYFLSFLFTAPVRLVHKRPEERESVWKSVVEGMQYIRKDRALLALMVLAAIANMFAFPCIMGIMPVFARDVLNLGASGLGWLISAEGLGGLFGALVASAVGGRFKKRGWLVIGAMILWPSLLGVFAGLRFFSLALMVLILVGIARGIAMAVMQMLLILWSSEEMHGRVVGVRMFAVLPLFAGNLISGAGADLWGAAMVIVINALACIVTAGFTAIWAPELRRR
jgi:MFS family permease